jgi:hypothetical protein
MSRPDHLQVVDVERSTVTGCVQCKGQGLRTKKSGYDRYAITLLKSKASSALPCRCRGPLPDRSYQVLDVGGPPLQWMCSATILD